MRIRKAQIQDSAQLARIQVDSYRTAYAGILPQPYLDHFTYEEQEQDWRDLLASDSEDLLYVAETAGGEIVGYTLGRVVDGESPPYDGELVALHVRRAWQKQDVGRQLVAAVAEQLALKGCTALLLWVLVENPARSFYERLGGQLIGEKTVRLGHDTSAVEVAYGWPKIDDLHL